MPPADGQYKNNLLGSDRDSEGGVEREANVTGQGREEEAAPLRSDSRGILRKRYDRFGGREHVKGTAVLRSRNSISAPHSFG
jgi:hypothetical protein